MAKSTASTVKQTHSPTGVGSQNSTPHSFTIPNVGCAASCVFSNNYNTCYNQCANPPASNPGSAYPPGSYGVQPIDVSGSKPVVSPGTNKTTTSGTAVSPTGVPQTGGDYGTTSTSGTPTSTAAPTSPFGTASWQDFGIRAGLVVGGSILIIVGVIKIFSNQPVIQNVPGTLPRRPSTPPKPIVTRRSFVETREVGKPVGGSAPGPAASTVQAPTVSAEQARVDATQGSPMATTATPAAKGPRKYTPKQVGAIHAKQRTHLAQK